MSHPPIRQLGFDAPPDGVKRWRGDLGARGIALEVRRRTELELQRHPAAAHSARSGRSVRHRGVARHFAVSVVAIVLAVAFVYAAAAATAGAF